MPWRQPNYEGEFPSLGWDVLDWVSENLRVPDGPFAGDPLELTDEQATLLVRWYQIDNRGRFVYRRGSKRAPQGSGKSPFLGAIALAELAGPVRFDGWDARGEPVAVRPRTPWVQIAAVSEDQTDNTYAAAYAMAQESPLTGPVIDLGLTRMYLTGGGGRLEPVTASSGSRLGQRITFAVMDETHLWLPRNGGPKLAATIRRNASKMDGRTFESTNAPALGEDSVAERTMKAAEKGAPGLLYEAFEAPPVEDLTDRDQVIDALKASYRDAVKWVDLPRLADEIADPGTDPADACRFYFNQARSSGSCPFDISIWEQLAAVQEVPPGTRVGLGFDGSISDDLTALYACTEQGHVFELGVWGPEPVTGLIPRPAVHEAVAAAFDRYDVGMMLVDPPKWRDAIDAWVEKYNRDTDRVVALDTQSARRFAPACDRFATAIRERSCSHDGRDTLTHHLAASARKQVRLADDETDGRTPFVIVKADARKIDCAVAAILALHAAMTMPDPDETVPRLHFFEEPDPLDDDRFSTV